MKTKKKHPVLKILFIILGILVFLCLLAFIIFRINPQYIGQFVGKVANLNSFEPVAETAYTVRDDGSFLVNDLQYGKDYPNSFLDIIYPSKDTAIKRPTILYLHGGGFFGGSKVSGDPLASGGVDDFCDYLVHKGFNLVKMDYALVPEYIQPTQLIQLDQATRYLTDNSEKLGLDMDNLVIMGGSAGAALTSQYGLILTNPAYAERIGVAPSISKEQVKALVIDDPPIDMDRSSWGLNTMVFAQVGTNNRSSEAFKLYQSAEFVDENYIPSFIVSANGDEFVDDADELFLNLQNAGVDAKYYTKTKEEAGKLVHCFMEVSFASNRYAQEATEQMIDFISNYVES